MSQPRKKYRALIIDIDGTLMISQRNALPTSKVTEAIRKAAKLLHVGIATQRTMASVIPVIKHLNLSGPSVIAGGAQVIDGKTFKLMHEVLIEESSLNKAIEILASFKKETGLDSYLMESDGEDIQLAKDYVFRKPIAIFLGGLTFNQADNLKKKLSVIDNIAVNKVVPWESKFGIVITGALATKQHGIFEVAKILGINTHEIIGIGDSYNDFPLLMACGLKVAMGNAVEDLKEIADYIAPSVEEDGVADVINKFVL